LYRLLSTPFPYSAPVSISFAEYLISSSNFEEYPASTLLNKQEKEQNNIQAFDFNVWLQFIATS